MTALQVVQRQLPSHIQSLVSDKFTECRVDTNIYYTKLLVIKWNILVNKFINKLPLPEMATTSKG